MVCWVWEAERKYTLWPFAYFISLLLCTFVQPMDTSFLTLWSLKGGFSLFIHAFDVFFFFFVGLTRMIGRILFVLYGSFYINYKFIRRDIFSILDFWKQIPSIKIINCMVKLDISVHLDVFLLCVCVCVIWSYVYT